jgi:hypothetical protein
MKFSAFQTQISMGHMGNTWQNQNDAQAGTRKRDVNSCKNRSSCGRGRQARVKDIMTKSRSSSEAVVDASLRKCIVVAQPGDVLGGWCEGRRAED